MTIKSSLCKLKVMRNLTYSLLSSKQTVFTAPEIAIILRETNMDLVKSKIHYYVKRGELISLRKGIYAKEGDYSNYELATRILSPSYISLETVLLKEGIIFQHQEGVTLISYQTRTVEIDSKNFVFRKIKDEILTNNIGLVNMGTYVIASKERAFLDTLYLYKEYHFDNVEGMNWDYCFVIANIYESKSLIRRLKKYV